MDRKLKINHEVIFNNSLIIILSSLLFLFVQCESTTPNDKILKEDKNYIYVRQYTMNMLTELDSVDKKYHKPITLQAEIIAYSRGRIILRNIKNKQEFEINDKDEYNILMENTKKIYKFKYTYYPTSKMGYTLVK